MPSRGLFVSDARLWAQLIPPCAQRAGGIAGTMLARANKSWWPRGLRGTEWNGGAQPPIWTAQLTARGSLITYVRKIIPCTPIRTHDTKSELAYVTTRARTFAPVYSKKCWRGGGVYTRYSERISSKDQNERCVSIRLIEWRAYRTILSLTNNNGYRHAQHATTSSLDQSKNHYK